MRSFNLQSVKQSKTLLILTAQQNDLPNNDRFINYSQKNVTLILSQTLTLCDFNPTFEYQSYFLSVLDSIPKYTYILSIKYKASRSGSDVLQIEKVSNLQASDSFSFAHDPSVEAVHLMVKTSPLPADKSEISFLISIRNKLSNTGKKSFAAIVLKVFYSSNLMQTYPIFTSPLIDRNIVTANLANQIVQKSTFISQLSSYVPSVKNAIVTYRILNRVENLFYIDTFNNVQLNYPFPDSINIKRFNYLVNLLKNNYLNQFNFFVNLLIFNLNCN